MTRTPWTPSTWLCALLLALLTIMAISPVSAKLASGPQNLSSGLHPAQSLFNLLPCQGKLDSSTTGALGCSVVTKGLGNNANFAQKTFGETFSAGGKFAGQTIDDVAGALRSGSLKPSDVPIDFIVRNGNTLILNTRSAQALTRADIPRSQWNTVNRTGQEAFEARLTGQLTRNRLTDQGIPTVRPSGGN